MEDIQVQRRQERARAGNYTIRNLGDHPIFSRFAVESTSGKTYEVTIRSLKERANSCSCPDFLTNLVGTCKHVEAVLLQVSPPEDDHQGIRQPRPQVYLHHGEELQVRLLWTPHPFGGGVSLQPLLERYFRPDGTFRGDLAKEFEGFREAAEQTRQVDIAPEVLSLVKDLRESALLSAERDQWLARLADGEHLNVTALPLYPYQERGVLHLAYGRRAMLADDIGSGKTVQAIGATELLRRDGRVRRALIICPPSVQHQWQSEIFRFAGVEALIVEPNSGTAAYERQSSYLIVSYEQVVKDVEHLAKTSLDLIILDEAHRIRDWRSRSAAAVKQLKSPFAFVLTGTPMEDRLDELYSVMQFLDQRLLGPLWRFNQRYYVLDAAKKPIGVKNLEDLRNRLGRVVMRRRRHEVEGELPDRVTNTFEVDMTPVQRRAYDDARISIGRILAKPRPPTEVERGRIVRHLARMRMACAAPELVDSTVDSTVVAPKLQELERILNDVLDEPGSKAIIFSEWERMVQLVGATLAALQIEFVTVTGKVPMNRRGEIIERFTTDASVRVLLSTDVGEAGMDTSRAGFVVNLDVPWSITRQEQRVSRALGPASPGRVNVINLVTRGSIEQALCALHEKKRTLHGPGGAPDAATDAQLLPTLLGKPDWALVRALIHAEPVEAALAEVPQPEAAALLAEFSQFLTPGSSPGLLPLPEAPAALPGWESAPVTRSPERGRPSGALARKRPPPPVPTGPHPGRSIGAMPVDPLERQQVLRRVFAEALGSLFKDVVRLGGGFVLVVARLDSRVQVQANGVASRLGVPILALDADGFHSLEQVIAPLVHGEAPQTEPATDTARQATARADRSRMRLSEARCLLAGGLGPAAVKATYEAMELAVEALFLIEVGTCPPPADFIGEVYGRLVANGVLRLELAAGISRAKDLAMVADSRGRGLVDANVARAVLQDAEAILQLAQSHRRLTR